MHSDQAQQQPGLPLSLENMINFELLHPPGENRYAF